MNDGIRHLTRTRRARAQLLLAAVCAVVTLAGTATVRAADDDYIDDTSFERKIIDNLMKGLGAQRGGDSGIDFRERSPLVVPPSMDLPPPETAPRANVANWPKDPDVARRKAEIAARKKKGPMRETEDDRLNPIRPSELDAGRGRPGAAGSNSMGVREAVNSDPLTPSQLGAPKGGLFGNFFSFGKQENVQFEREPERSSLVQPPPGYQTPAPSQAYGPGKEIVDEFVKEREMEARRQSGDPSAK